MNHIKFDQEITGQYVSPDMIIVDIHAEGMLCASNESLDEYEGVW